MFDSPTPEEILQALAILLNKEVLPALSGDVAFKVRVAANALDLIRRQLVAESAAKADWLERSRFLLGFNVAEHEADREMASLIASGALPADDRLLRLLLANTLGKLAIDQPNYTAGREARLAAGLSS